MNCNEFDGITAWHERALNIANERPDENLWEFDLSIWRVFLTLVIKSPEQAKAMYKLSSTFMDAIQRHGVDDAIELLPSGVICSFKVDIDDDLMIRTMEEARNGRQSFIDHLRYGVELDCAYWLTMNRVALRDKDFARVAFGRSKKLIEAVANATDNQIRYAASKIGTRISLRNSEQVILNVIESERGDQLKRLAQKYQQALSKLMD